MDKVKEIESIRNQFIWEKGHFHSGYGTADKERWIIDVGNLLSHISTLEARIKELEEGIKEVLDDEESRPGAWGPDVTCVGKLQKLIEKEGG